MNERSAPPAAQPKAPPAASAQVAASPAAPAAPLPATPAAPPLSPEQKFGLSDAQLRARESNTPASAPLSDLHAHIVRVVVGAANRQLFILDNGQTWQQIELDTDFLVRPAEAVTITRGALGSFWLSANPHRATRVKRLR
ncbi:MAG: hypothetical protein ACLP2F_01985 [Steroidobacteraceae bacterium]